MTPDFSGAPCIGRPELFESTHTADHYEARELCATCPALEACKVLLSNELVATKGTRKAGGGPCGTWAGELIGARGKRESNTPREHGTERGYQQHRYRKEESCAPCREACRAAMDVRLKAGVVCGEPLVTVTQGPDNESKDTTNASRPRTTGGCTPVQGLADRKDTTDSCTW